jgi:ribosomal protein L11 methyltransferase
MPFYYEVHFNNISATDSDILVALLSETNVNGFEEQENSLKVFFSEKDFDETTLVGMAGTVQATYDIKKIEEENWNQLWESNFSPVTVENWVAVRADFHAPISNVVHEIVITPKMSFGTGHHATTYMMLAQMQELQLTGKKVFDFGTGTGVLAILAKKMGAADITAVDYDEWSIENTRENMTRNHAEGITLIQADTAEVNNSFDVILANINKNVILDNMETLARELNPGGTIFFSGLLIADQQDIVTAAQQFGLQLVKVAERNKWLFINMLKS